MEHTQAKVKQWRHHSRLQKRTRQRVWNQPARAVQFCAYDTIVCLMLAGFTAAVPDQAPEQPTHRRADSANRVAASFRWPHSITQVQSTDSLVKKILGCITSMVSSPDSI